VTRTTTTRVIAEQLPNLNSFEAKAEPGMKSLAFLFKEINAQKEFKPEKTESSKKRKAEY
jgi:hypothetical protein